MGEVADEVAEKISEYRKTKKITQKELSRKLNLHNSAISNWELKRNSIDLDTLYKLCVELNISVADVFGKFSNENQKINPESLKLFRIYNNLNAEGEEELLKHAMLLAESSKYKKDSQYGLLQKEA